MCGRFDLHAPKAQITKYFDLAECPEVDPRYNISPTSSVLVIRQRHDIGRVGQLVNWGLVPLWAKEPSIGAKLINARAETVAEKPSFRTSFARHRCLIPADGFFEWMAVTEDGKPRKQPYYIRPAEEDGLFAFAGLLARWRAPDGTDLVTTCIITTTPNAVMAEIHDRMPVILAREAWEGWLDPENLAADSLVPLLKPCPAGVMLAYPVSAAVNRAGVEGAGLIEPLAPE